MLQIDAEAGQGRTRESLRMLLSACLERAHENQHAQLANVNLKVTHLSALAVLASIYEPQAPHLYMARQSMNSAQVGIESVAELETSGAGRFSEAKAWAEKWKENTISVSDADAPLKQPMAFASFAFEDELLTGEATARVFIPRWQVHECPKGYTATANIIVEEGADIEPLIDRVWAAYQKFSAFDYGPLPQTVSSIEALEPNTDVDDFQARVAQAVQSIKEGAFDKIVLARKQSYTAPAQFRLFDTVSELLGAYPGCTVYSIGDKEGGSLVGATPECLMRVSKELIQADCIAGSAPRGKGAIEDAQLAGQLLSSEKDSGEHNWVREFIFEKLAGLGLQVDAPEQAQLMKLQNVQHLYTPITAEGKNIHPLDVANALHPTPAVCGVPSDVAKAAIGESEPFQRGLYAGTFGWFDWLGEGEFFVALRCAQLSGNTATLYAGGGIVEQSDPDSEFAETDWKMSAIRDTLRFENG